VDREEAEPRMNSTLPTVPLDDERRERLVAAAKAMLEQAVYEIPPQPGAQPIKVPQVSPSRSMVKPSRIIGKRAGDETKPDFHFLSEHISSTSLFPSANKNEW
jgi:hypothetical protein